MTVEGAVAAVDHTIFYNHCVPLSVIWVPAAAEVGKSFGHPSLPDDSHYSSVREVGSGLVYIAHLAHP